jgi:TRAP-type C4-dicarboxylate transport system substrate-binding protein
MRAGARLLTALSLAAIVVAACGGGEQSAQPPAPDAGAKAGGRPGPIAITIADSQPADKPSNRPLAEFKRQVEQLSGGTMTVTIVTRAVDDVAPGSDAAVIDRVRQGTFQMAVVPARAWSAAGVTSLKALQAPFLFDSDEHVAAVVDDAGITADLFSGLDGSGVTGLTLFPESLRHLFGFDKPFLAPADVRGRTIRAITSPETTALIEALGGTAVDPADDAYQRGVDDGTIQGTDSGFVLATVGDPNRSATATGNVALYAKVMTLVINSALWSGLDDAQRAIITTASDATRAWAVANQENDTAAAAAFCAGGGTVVLADAASIAAFRAAEAPVYTALEVDPATKRAIAAIRALAASTSRATVEACGPADDASTLVPHGGDLPNGIYRIEATEAYLKSGFPEYVETSAGIYTFTLRDGRWSFDYVAYGGGEDHQAGVYRAEGDDVDWLWDPCCSHPNPVLHLKWSVDGVGTLHFRLVSGPPDWALALPFARVGDAPDSTSPSPSPASPAFAPDGGDLPNGIYRVEYTDTYLRGWGVTNIPFQHGIWTYRLEDGQWTIDQVADDVTDHLAGVYRVEGHDLYWRWDNERGKPVEHLTWSAAANGDLTFAPGPGVPAGWTFGLPLIRVRALD